MATNSMSVIGVECPYCGFNMPIPIRMSEWEWKCDRLYESKREWHCVNCGEKHTIKAKRHIHDAEVVRVTDGD